MRRPTTDPVVRGEDEMGDWLTTDCRRCDDKRRAGLTGAARFSSRMIVCPDCGNKRCPKATWHGNACTGSNEPGQIGSDYGPSPSCACRGVDEAPGCTHDQPATASEPLPSADDGDHEHLWRETTTGDVCITCAAPRDDRQTSVFEATGRLRQALAQAQAERDQAHATIEAVKALADTAGDLDNGILVWDLRAALGEGS